MIAHTKNKMSQEQFSKYISMLPKTDINYLMSINAKTKKRIAMSKKSGNTFYNKSCFKTTEKEDGIPPFILSEFLKSRLEFSEYREIEGINFRFTILAGEGCEELGFPPDLSIFVYC